MDYLEDVLPAADEVSCPRHHCLSFLTIFQQMTILKDESLAKLDDEDLHMADETCAPTEVLIICLFESMYSLFFS